MYTSPSESSKESAREGGQDIEEMEQEDPSSASPQSLLKTVQLSQVTMNQGPW